MVSTNSVSIGPNLAKNIKPPTNKASFYDYADVNTQSLAWRHPCSFTIQQMNKNKNNG